MEGNTSGAYKFYIVSTAAHFDQSVRSRRQKWYCVHRSISVHEHFSLLCAHKFVNSGIRGVKCLCYDNAQMVPKFMLANQRSTEDILAAILNVMWLADRNQRRHMLHTVKMRTWCRNCCQSITWLQDGHHSTMTSLVDDRRHNFGTECACTSCASIWCPNFCLHIWLHQMLYHLRMIEVQAFDASDPRILQVQLYTSIFNFHAHFAKTVPVTSPVVHGIHKVQETAPNLFRFIRHTPSLYFPVWVKVWVSCLTNLSTVLEKK